MVATAQSPARKTKRLSAQSPASARKAKRVKQSRFANPADVVEALLLPEAFNATASDKGLLSLLKSTLPAILKENKVDRQAFENEVVVQAEASLQHVLADLQAKHSAAQQKQDEVCSPSEHASRRKAKQDSEAGLAALVKQLEGSKENQAALKKAVQECKSANSALQKEANTADKEMTSLNSKKTSLSELLANEYELLQNEASTTPAGKQAVKKLESAGKHYNLDPTLLQTFPLTAKKEPSSRSEFETMMFTSLKAAIEKETNAMSAKLVELEPQKAEKTKALAEAAEKLEKMQAELSSANEEHSKTQAAHKEAEKAVEKAEEFVYQIWNDMKAACDAQDERADSITEFKKNLDMFNQLRDREPEPEEPEPTAEVAEGTEAAPAANA